MTIARGRPPWRPPLEFLQPEQELAASAPGDHDDARRIDVVSPRSITGSTPISLSAGMMLKRSTMAA